MLTMFSALTAIATGLSCAISGSSFPLRHMSVIPQQPLDCAVILPQQHTPTVQPLPTTCTVQTTAVTVRTATTTETELHTQPAFTTTAETTTTTIITTTTSVPVTTTTTASTTTTAIATEPTELELLAEEPEPSDETEPIAEEKPITPENSTCPAGLSILTTMETWFKSYMDYRCITDSSSMQYQLQQQAWTDEQGLRRIASDYLVAMGTGWLEAGCGERFAVTLETGMSFTVMIGDVKADCHTDATHCYRPCGHGANVLEFIVDTDVLDSSVRNAGTISTYTEFAGNIVEIIPIS